MRRHSVTTDCCTLDNCAPYVRFDGSGTIEDGSEELVAAENGSEGPAPAGRGYKILRRSPPDEWSDPTSWYESWLPIQLVPTLPERIEFDALTGPERIGSEYDNGDMSPRVAALSRARGKRAWRSSNRALCAARVYAALHRPSSAGRLLGPHQHKERPRL